MNLIRVLTAKHIEDVISIRVALPGFPLLARLSDVEVELLWRAFSNEQPVGSSSTTRPRQNFRNGSVAKKEMK
jgi:hypothetical protein